MFFLKLIFKEQPKGIIVFCILTLLASTLPPILVVINKEAIDKISVVNTDPTALKIALILLISHFLLQYLNQVFDIFKEYIFTKISYSINYILKQMMAAKFIDIPLKEYEDSEFYDTINLANRAISGSGVKVAQNLISIVGSIVSLIGIFGILLSIHWSLPFALFLSTLPGIIFIFIAKFRNYKVQKENSPKERELGFTDNLFTNKSSLREIKIYKIGNYLIGKWKKLYLHVQERNLKIALWDSRTQSIAGFILSSASFGVSLLLVFQIYNNSLTIGSYVALISAITTVQGLFGAIGGELGNIFETAIYNKALLKITNYQNNQSNLGGKVTINNIESIEIQNASFLYPKSNETVLRNVSLKINQGESISIVGFNGSGKTTLVNCLLGLYDLNGGTLKVNGIDIKNINKDSYLNNFSAIFQDFIRYKFSVRENVGFGDLSKLTKDQDIFRVIDEVGMLDKFKEANTGIDHYLTKEMPNGSELSGGEWQRLAIARAFLKESEFVILDEPTAALDPITELKIFETFHLLSKTKTTITISHRIGPTRLSDRIIVMDKGEVVEEGSFQELINKQGLYYEMYTSQSKWYQDEELEVEVI